MAFEYSSLSLFHLRGVLIFTRPAAKLCRLCRILSRRFVLILARHASSRTFKSGAIRDMQPIRGRARRYFEEYALTNRWSKSALCLHEIKGRWPPRVKICEIKGADPINLSSLKRSSVSEESASAPVEPSFFPPPPRHAAECKCGRIRPPRPLRTKQDSLLTPIMRPVSYGSLISEPALWSFSDRVLSITHPNFLLLNASGAIYYFSTTTIVFFKWKTLRSDDLNSFFFFARPPRFNKPCSAHINAALHVKTSIIRAPIDPALANAYLTLANRVFEKKGRRAHYTLFVSTFDPRILSFYGSISYVEKSSRRLFMCAQDCLRERLLVRAHKMIFGHWGGDNASSKINQGTNNAWFLLRLLKGALIYRPCLHAQ